MEIWWGLGYHTIFFLAGLAAIPKDLPDAARIDGANEWQIFWYVTRPRLAPIMMVLVVLRFGTAMAVIDEYLIFGGFNRASPTYTWTIFMYDQAFKLGLWRQGYAAAIGMIGAARHDVRHGAAASGCSVPRTDGGIELPMSPEPIDHAAGAAKRTAGGNSQAGLVQAQAGHGRPACGHQPVSADHPAAAGLGPADVGEDTAGRDARRFPPEPA